MTGWYVLFITAWENLHEATSHHILCLHVALVAVLQVHIAEVGHGGAHHHLCDLGHGDELGGHPLWPGVDLLLYRRQTRRDRWQKTSLDGCTHVDNPTPDGETRPLSSLQVLRMWELTRKKYPYMIACTE